MFCANCGQQVPDGSPSCQNCGVHFAGAAAAPPPPAYGTPPPAYGPPAPQVPDYLVWSILELLFCCLPFGVVGLVYSIQANTAKAAGRYQEAMSNAEKAKNFLIYGMIGWAVMVVLYIGIIILGVVAENM